MFVPMTNTKQILAISFTVIFAVALIGATPIADAITDLVKTNVKVEGDEIKRIAFKLSDDVPTDAFGGYAIFTENDVLAVTSHGGFFDSEAQILPQEEPQQSLSISAVLCAENDAGCGGEWHTHVVKPADNSRCGFKAVGALSFQEPSAKVKVDGKKIIVRGVDIGERIYLDSASSTGQLFSIGNPVDADVALGLPDDDGRFTGTAFDLNAAFDDTTGLIEAICIGEVLPDTPDKDKKKKKPAESALRAE